MYKKKPKQHKEIDDANYDVMRDFGLKHKGAQSRNSKGELVQYFVETVGGGYCINPSSTMSPEEFINNFKRHVGK